MSWFNTFLQAANVASNVAQYNQMRQLNELHQFGAMTDDIRRAIKNYIFQISQVKEELLFYKERDPIGVFAGLLILTDELKSSGIKPEFFDDISDKEYCASCQRSIRLSQMDLRKQLSDDEVELAHSAIKAITNIEEMDYLLNNYRHAESLRAGKRKLHELDRNRPGTFANRSEWSRQRQDTIRKIDASEAAFSLEKYNDCARKHFSHGSKVEFTKSYRSNEAVLKTVFEHMPRLDKILVAQFKQES